MFQQYLQTQNPWALLVSAIVYWGIGAVWFSALFGKAWMAEHAKMGKTIERPSNKEFSGMMLGTFMYNVLIVFAVSYIVFITGAIKPPAAFKMGALLGGCMVWTSIGITYTWERRSMRHLALDAGYHFVGVLASCMILAMWR
ncbi:MAG: DUF1761 domain-containing protein [Bacteroidetes bacterium]|nr:DUF1761 domain-containing protein [Bacteroidota bacterium]